MRRSGVKKIYKFVDEKALDYRGRVEETDFELKTVKSGKTLAKIYYTFEDENRDPYYKNRQVNFPYRTGDGRSGWIEIEIEHKGLSIKRSNAANGSKFVKVRNLIDQSAIKMTNEINEAFEELETVGKRLKVLSDDCDDDCYNGPVMTKNCFETQFKDYDKFKFVVDGHDYRRCIKESEFVRISLKPDRYQALGFEKVDASSGDIEEYMRTVSRVVALGSDALKPFTELVVKLNSLFKFRSERWDLHRAVSKELYNAARNSAEFVDYGLQRIDSSPNQARMVKITDEEYILVTKAGAYGSSSDFDGHLINAADFKKLAEVNDDNFMNWKNLKILFADESRRSPDRAWVEEDVEEDDADDSEHASKIDEYNKNVIRVKKALGLIAGASNIQFFERK